jgi:hypothetical protein
LDVPRNTLGVLDLFSGIGGISLGLERAGPFRTVSFCEALESRRRILRRHWPDVEIHDDVRTLDGGRFRHGDERADVICGGFPCQDISLAGRGAGLEGERSGLWSEFARLIGEIGPKWVVARRAAPDAGLGGREAGDRNLPEGQPHVEGDGPGPSGGGASPYAEVLLRPALLREQSDRAVERYWPETWRERLDRVDDMDARVPGSVEQLSALGATVVVAIPEMIGNAIMIAEGLREPPADWDDFRSAA